MTRPRLLRIRLLLCLLPSAFCLLGSVSFAATPIPEGANANDAPAFIGTPAVQQPVFVPQPPRHPHMAPNERSNLHVDAYQTDANPLAGPLGKGITRVSAFHSADCASVTFDSRGRIVVVCVGLQGPGAGGAGLYMLDPKTLDELAKLDLPGRQPGISTDLFTDFSGGGYFYLDDQDRAVIPTTTRHILVVAETGAQPGFTIQRDYDVSGAVPSDDKIISALPDWSGRLWFASMAGIVGTVDPASGTVKSMDMKEKIGNSFAVDETGAVYIVTDGALYALRAGSDGTPRRVWRSTYLNDGRAKPGQTELGSGTTPTVMTTGPWVTITDNSDPIDVVVYNRVTGAQVCAVPAFSRGASDTDQSLNVAGNAIVVENNYGYSGPAATEQGKSTTPGLERIDVNSNGKGCHKVWHSDEIAPSVVPKISLANGLVYTYTKPAGESSDPWYLTALDFRTGRTIYKARAGAGLGFNNNYAPVTIGPDGTAYVGVLGGLVALRDSTPPPQVPQSRGRSRLTLRARYGRRHRCSARRAFSVRLAGVQRGQVKSVVFTYHGKRVRDRRAPFAARFRVGPARLGRRVTARVTLRGGGHRKLSRVVRPCR
ncbi:MAG: hypothetical protein QOK31_2014 [Solirubrobacteraceae bacterium]|nr:hypothetical protein [Solirubrobacteraceae bacterium]